MPINVNELMDITATNAGADWSAPASADWLKLISMIRQRCSVVIGRLQVKVRRMTVMEQEKLMNEKVQMIAELQRDLDLTRTTLKETEAEATEAKDKLEESRQKLREARDKIKDNENGQFIFQQTRTYYWILNDCSWLIFQFRDLELRNSILWSRFQN